MNIGEKDIFLFVKYPDQLGIDKKLYIEENINLYKDKIEYLRSIKEIEFENINPITREYEAVLEQQSITDVPGISNNSFKLAAATKFGNESGTCITFSDTDKNIFAKVINEANVRKIFILSEELVNNIKLTILPSNDEYSLDPLKSSLELPNDKYISGIKLTYNKLFI